MNPLTVFLYDEAVIFHIRAGGCGGCGDVVDGWMRSYSGRWWKPLECGTPRHADLVIVTGCPLDDYHEAVMSVIEQAPHGCKTLMMGDCALGSSQVCGPSGKKSPLAADACKRLKVSGCPVEEGLITGEVKRCLGLS